MTRGIGGEDEGVFRVGDGVTDLIKLTQRFRRQVAERSLLLESASGTILDEAQTVRSTHRKPLLKLEPGELDLVSSLARRVSRHRRTQGHPAERSGTANP